MLRELADDDGGQKSFKAIFREHRQQARVSPSFAVKGSPPVLCRQRLGAPGLQSRSHTVPPPSDHLEECLLETSTELISSAVSQHSVGSSCSSGSCPRRHSSNLDFRLIDMPPRPQGTQVSKPGRWRRKRRESAQNLVGRHSHISSQDGSRTNVDSFDTVVAFVARRVYRRVREGTRLQSTPPLLYLFDEAHFLASAARQRETSRWCCLLFWRRREDVAPSVNARDIFDFLFRFTTWCAMPADLIIVALVYVDMLVDRDQARGVLTVQSWRPLLVGCLLLASKVYEDWCICNFEAAQFSGFTDASMLRLELLVMDTLNWNVNISAETFAPYFWAVERVISEGRDDMDSSFSVTLTAAEREQLEERVGLSPLNLCSTPTHNRSIQSVTLASASLSMSLCSDPGCDSPHSSSSTISLPVGGGMRCVNGFSFNDFRLQVDTLDEATRASFVFVDRFESRYKLHEALGHGTFGVVHRITRRGEPDKMLAVKLFTSKGLSEGAVSSAARKTTALVQSFFLSGVAASMKHPNIVRFVEIVIDESRSTPLASIVPIMEVLHGPDLFDWLATRQNEVELGQREWISERAVAAIMKQVLSGLQYLHGNTPSVVHRDVKAENLRWASNAPDALLKLVDFGLVYIDGYEDPMDGEVVGTPSYSAPEMLNTVSARRPNAALDMYAAGVVLFLLFSARFPFTETADRTVLPEMDSGSWAHVSQCVLILLRQLLNPHPDGRPSSEEALRSAWFIEADVSHKSAASPVHPLPTPTASVLSLRDRSSLPSAAVTSESTP